MGRDQSDEFRSSAGTDVKIGSVLVSAPVLRDSTFRRTVVYMIEHNDSGSLGVVLNRPSESAVHGVLPQWHDLAAKPKAVFVGGPVNQTSALCLGVVKAGQDVQGIRGLQQVSGRVVLVDLDADVDMMDELLDGVRVFAGYSGWGMGQLDDELARDDWIVCESHHTDILVPQRVDLWARVLRRQALPLALLATHPIDVTLN
ncbi:YqgE/AlgH family protein [Tsukamurella sp. 8F]|uniref:YqgE/AlgH family protein n=1 Tax=unclassified Tsukamurella TaxID=2633480 RepID=UPI0023B96C82|nr:MULTISPECIES: YqgE/AlgH family protein [unclassified Tsukamurella]MDF0529427.1 YqgE/AlgH family protein [Tsukamurella sp. 8J]MDF0587066.1 YqgE/AlgH family protein [Tsukamurella sp. 8F]